MMLLLLLAAQSASPAASPPAAPTSFSILQPVPDEPCVRRGSKNTDPDDIVVCGKPLPSQALPYPNEAVLDEPRPSNPDLRGTGALALEATPCAGRSGGCGSGIDLFGMGTAAVRLVQKAVAPGSCCEEPGEGTNVFRLAKDTVGGVKRAFRKKPDKSRRVPILLDDTPPATFGKVTG
ncbi:MAG: hypothetical protein V4522_00960 [Pseudomonadota bacterium]|nr:MULTISPECIES: hypothetical protein [unclassified Sphingomonas]MDR6850256.1 hypothetical protein [Sphingomonas sp. BE137]